jgi:hypothetical protein
MSCKNGGPGTGEGGSPGRIGENCFALGNVLVIQESNIDVPAASEAGGNITFAFSDRVDRFESISLFGIPPNDTVTIASLLVSGDSETKTIDGLGYNSVQNITLGWNDVQKVTIHFPGLGAISLLKFCLNIDFTPSIGSTPVNSSTYPNQTIIAATTSSPSALVLTKASSMPSSILASKAPYLSKTPSSPTANLPAAHPDIT